MRQVIRRKPVNLKSNDSFLFDKEYNRSFPLPAESIIELKGLVVKGASPVFLKDISLIQKALRLEHLNLSLKERFKVLFPNQSVPEGIIAADAWSGNYFHWFTDSLVKIQWSAKQYPNAKVFLPVILKQCDFIEGSLWALKLTNRVVWCKNYEFKKLKTAFIPKFSYPTGNYNAKLLQELQESLIVNEAEPPKRKVFIHRKTTRKIINQIEVDEVLKAAGFESYYLEDLSWRQQVHLFSSTKVICAVHGAGLTNMLFMPKGGQVIELRKKEDVNNNCYFTMASDLNMAYYYLQCEVDDDSKNTQKNDFIVDTEAFKKILDEAV